MAELVNSFIVLHIISGIFLLIEQNHGINFLLAPMWEVWTLPVCPDVAKRKECSTEAVYTQTS